MTEYNVTPFVPKREMVWQHKCPMREQKVWLMSDGRIQCTGCSQIVTDIVWGDRYEKAPGPTPAGGGG